MNSINKVALTPVFMTAYSAPRSPVVAWACGRGLAGRAQGAVLVLAGSALYLVETIVVTRAADVPLNDVLMTADPDGAGAAGRWTTYLADWIVWTTRAPSPPSPRRAADRRAARQSLTA